MSRIVEFLQNNSQGLEILKSKYSIDHARHEKYGNLVLLKYDQFNSPLTDPLVKECRGIILDEADNWNIIAYPYDKFFNISQLQNQKVIDWNNPVRVYDKIDGSLMTLYFYKGEWQVASSGLPSASGGLPRNKKNNEHIVNDEESCDVKNDDNLLVPEKKFSDLFWQTWNSLGYELPNVESADIHKCYMFELATPENTVLIHYEKPILYLHGVRNLQTLKEESIESFCEKYNWIRIPGEIVNSKKEFEEKHLSKIEKLDGLKQEGYILCDCNFQRIKIKSPTYVSLSLLNNKEKQIWKRLIRVVQLNEGDEFLAYFPEFKTEYEILESKYHKIIKLTQDILQKCESLPKAEMADQIKILPEWLKKALFTLRKLPKLTASEYFADIKREVTLKKLLNPLVDPGIDNLLP